MRRAWLIPLLISLLTGSVAAQTGDEPAKEPTPEERARAALEPLLLGPWALVKERLSDGVDQAAVRTAAERCFIPMAIDAVIAGQFTEDKDERGLPEDFPSRSELRGDLLFYVVGKDIYRLDYRARQLVRTIGVERGKNARNEDYYGLTTELGVYPMYFSDFGYEVAGSGFMVAGDALYLRCPPLPDRD